MTSRHFVRDSGDDARHKVGKKQQAGRYNRSMAATSASQSIILSQSGSNCECVPLRRAERSCTARAAPAVPVDNYDLLVRLALVWGRFARIISLADVGADEDDPTVERSTSRNVPSAIMKSYRQISLVFLLAVLADGTAAQAQSPVDGRFNRVTTPGVRRTSAGTSSSVRSVSRSGGIAAVAGASSQIDSLRPYSTQAQARIQGQSDGTPKGSTWRQESVPIVIPQVVTETAPHNYYPGMRSSRSIQQPVTLTARATGAPHICIPSRSMMVGGSHHGR